jgi:hypothetical protein
MVWKALPDDCHDIVDTFYCQDIVDSHQVVIVDRHDTISDFPNKCEVTLN